MDGDGDGWSDGDELIYGTDPLDPQDFPPSVPLALAARRVRHAT